MKHYIFIFFCFLFSGCTISSPWQFDAIATGEHSFDSNRLIYFANDPLSEANLEFYCTEGNLSAYITSLARKLGTGSTAKAKLIVDSESFEEELFLREGKMRVKLPDAWTIKTIEALNDGHEVAIMIGAIEQTIRPERFSELFEKLAKGMVQSR